jgi:hypothetical protein
VFGLTFEVNSPREPEDTADIFASGIDLKDIVIEQFIYSSIERAYELLVFFRIKRIVFRGEIDMIAVPGEHDIPPAVELTSIQHLLDIVLGERHALIRDYLAIELLLPVLPDIEIHTAVVFRNNVLVLVPLGGIPDSAEEIDIFVFGQRIQRETLLKIIQLYFPIRDQ